MKGKATKKEALEARKYQNGEDYIRGR